MSLANKHRPATFEDVCGQNNNVAILKHMIETDCIPAAMGFFGASGCGKTTLARICAYLINKGKGHPIEQDAASNNSVDDVRQIIENAKQRSLDSEYKIFIIDEAHAITSQGWQAFLKLLEEPNRFTKFIFCTTNPEKIPDTVISRLQTFTFSKLSDDLIISRLRHISDIEQFDISDESLSYIARVSNGSMRQSITNLEKCAARGSTISYDTVIETVGTADYNIFTNLYSAIYANDARRAIKLVEGVYSSGKDIRTFVFEFLKFMLDLTKANMFDKDLSLTTLPNTTEICALFSYSDKFKSTLDNLVEFYEDNKLNSDIRFILEAKLISWCSQV